MRPRQVSRNVLIGVVGCLALLAMATITIRRGDDGRPAPSPAPAAVRKQVPAGTPAGAPAGAALPGEVVLRPLPVAHASASHEWTAGDAGDPAVIERIAHNVDEALRMLGENERIHRRQLVYRNETAATVVQRAGAAGEPVRQLTLPGLDGQEFEFEVQRAELAPSGQAGTFTGRLAGKPNSMVTLAFKGGREAFSVNSPDDGLYLQADPREPGEVIVKSIDPETYIEGQCGTPGCNH